MSMLDRLRAQSGTIRAVAYARYSSDLQREESIEGQLRAIETFAAQNHIAVVDTYVDRAVSGTTDQRPDFQRMVQDAKEKRFDLVIVHKLDRFSRSRYDSLGYRSLLKRNGVQLISVLEQFDSDSPESIITESVLEAMNEYYVRNLAREVEKGKRENAYKALHVGGIPPLGYDVDRNTMKLQINEQEAAAVRLIFTMYSEGCGYTEIIQALNREGYHTKRNRPFGKGSLYEILRNEKYCGTYVYNKSAAKDVDGKYNRHAHKPDSDVIRIEDAVPVIIEREMFDAVQSKMNQRRHKAGRYTAKEVYLLSGKIICGECGAAYTGLNQKPRANHPQRVVYRCSQHHGASRCSNGSIGRDYIEQLVLKQLSGYIFSEQSFPDIADAYQDYLRSLDTASIIKREAAERRLKEIDRNICNIVNVMMTTGSSTLSAKLQELETQKVQTEHQLDTLMRQQTQATVDLDKLHDAFCTARTMFASGTLRNERSRELLALFVDKVLVYHDRIEIRFNLGIDPSETIHSEQQETADENSAVFLSQKLRQLLTVEEKRRSVD